MGHREEHFEFGIADFGFILPKLSDSSGRHEYRQHHPCHSEWSRLLRFFVACRLLRMTVNGESLNLSGC